MKAISIKDPWAGLIINGQKTMELRSWNTRHRGLILIHRSGTNGGIIGTAQIVEVVTINSLGQFVFLRDKHLAIDKFYQARLFGWTLRNARTVEFIPCKGRLGLWEPSAEIQAQFLTGLMVSTP